MSQNWAVILFHTSNHAIRAEKVLKEAGHTCRLIPVPRHLSSDCGVCLRIPIQETEACRLATETARVEIAAIHPMGR
jgi:hypothetical protein